MKYFLALIGFVGGILLCPLSSSAKIDPNLIVGMWLFDEGSGDVAQDSSGNGNDGKLMNGPKWTSGKFGQGLEFAFGRNDYVIAPIPHSHSLTVALWAFYTDLPTANSGLIHVQATEDPGGAPATKIVGMWVENSRRLWGRIIQADGTIKNLPKNKELQAKTWYHIAITVDAQDKKAIQWVNGEPVGEVDYNGKLKDFAFIKIGRQGTESWSGILDEVFVSHQVLRAGDLKMLMEGLERALSVELREKLATAWGSLKRGI